MFGGPCCLGKKEILEELHIKQTIKSIID